MTCARSEVVREGEIGVYHCVHRCVRRAFLCGEDERTGRSFDHRRGWLRDRLKELSSVFAIEVGGFSVMENHLHAVLRTRPDLADGFAAEELASRWWRLFPKRRVDPMVVGSLDPAGWHRWACQSVRANRRSRRAS